MFDVGAVLADKYRIDRVLGRGGMGMVIAATHLQLQQQVALKFLLPQYLMNDQVIERFVREARASAALRSEHVCRVSDVGALETGAPYIVMELLEGSDLASLLARNGPLPASLACDYVLQACVGIAEAHALGVVHRDLKPANLFLTRRPDGMPLVKVLDFGIAKAQTDSNLNLTQTASVLGSPGYMSPEQLRSSRDVDLRTDVWSLGVILFELVTGKLPFTADSITELAIRVAMDPLPPLAGRVPAGFEQVVEGCLAKDPAQRYPELASLAHALSAHAGPNGHAFATSVSRLLHVVPRVDLPVSSPVSAVAMTQLTGASTPPATTLGAAASSMVTAHPPRSRRRWPWIAGPGVIVAGVIAIAVAVAANGGKGDAPGKPAAATAPRPVSDAAASAPPIDTGRSDPAGSAMTASAPPIDAGVTDAPSIDAGAADAARPTRRRPPRRRPRRGEDFGESRF